VKRTLLIICVILLCGCATRLPSSAFNIREADEKMICNCKYLGDVHGSSGWGNLAASTGIQNAKIEALKMASQLGATHVQWTSISGGYSPYVNGRAYMCTE
jgi:hypothetical protein